MHSYFAIMIFAIIPELLPELSRGDSGWVLIVPWGVWVDRGRGGVWPPPTGPREVDETGVKLLTSLCPPSRWLLCGECRAGLWVLMPTNKKATNTHGYIVKMHTFPKSKPNYILLCILSKAKSFRFTLLCIYSKIYVKC